jgi:hypothetical protein
MIIQCPNGHKSAVLGANAGRRAKCPKCSAVFLAVDVGPPELPGVPVASAASAVVPAPLPAPPRPRRAGLPWYYLAAGAAAWLLMLVGGGGILATGAALVFDAKRFMEPIGENTYYLAGVFGSSFACLAGGLALLVACDAGRNVRGR